MSLVSSIGLWELLCPHFTHPPSLLGPHIHAAQAPGQASMFSDVQYPSMLGFIHMHLQHAWERRDRSSWQAGHPQ